MNFQVYPLRFVFTAHEPVHFPAGKPGNILRGALGTIFQKMACAPDCRDARSCEQRWSCAYARLFEPAALGAGPSGLADWPRPFVFRARPLDGRTVAAGDSFDFDLNVFEMREPALACFVMTFAELAREGLGPRRGRAELRAVDQLDASGRPSTRIYDGAAFRATEGAAPVSVELTAPPAPVRQARVRFLTPTELKCGQALAERPEFPVLFARIRDRVSTLRALYGAGPLEIDFRAMGDRASRIRTTRCELRRIDQMRKSSKTGQVHPLGGFVGEADYEGDLGEFVPFLDAARWTGVGRQTVWGKGEIDWQRYN